MSIVLHPPLSLRSPFHYRRHISCHSGKTGTSTPMPVAASWFSKALGQRLNTAGVLWSLKVATKQPQLLIPHVSVADIRSIEWDVLEKAGFRGVVFDKDNTITAPYSLALWPLLESSFKKCCDAFPGKVAVLSNSAGMDYYGCGSDRSIHFVLNSLTPHLFFVQVWMSMILMAPMPELSRNQFKVFMWSGMVIPTVIILNPKSLTWMILKFESILGERRNC